MALKSLLKSEIKKVWPNPDEKAIKKPKNKRLKFSSDLKKSIKNSDIIFICVGTPTKKNSNSADLKNIYSVSKDLKKIIKKYKIIVTKSTVPVSTGDQIEKILISLKKKKLVDNV